MSGLFDRNFLTLMPDRIGLLTRASVAQYGRSVNAPVVQMTCAWAPGDQGTQTGEASRVGTVYASPPAYWDTPPDPAPEPSTKDQLQLPNGETVGIMSVKTWRYGGELFGYEIGY